ncbi:MAG TPA: DUF2269 family protein [Gaiella sp.]|jgi:uncharacterized membrane protein|nr:DUF2269 family protein [Gaiella sp.]
MDQRPEAAASPAARPFGGFGVDTILAGVLLFAGAMLFLSLAPSAYYVYLAIHVLSAVIWVGGDVTLTVLGIVFERRGEGETLAALGRMGAWIGTRVYTPTLVVTLVFGIILVQKGNFDWGQFWVIFALVGWTIAAVVGVAFVGPELGRIDDAARAHGPDSPEVAARVRRLFTIFRFDTALLLLIVVNMVAKPSF